MLVEALAAQLSSTNTGWSSESARAGGTGKTGTTPRKPIPTWSGTRQLPELEKAYDRLTVVQTLKAVVAPGDTASQKA